MGITQFNPSDISQTRRVMEYIARQTSQPDSLNDALVIANTYSHLMESEALSVHLVALFEDLDRVELALNSQSQSNQVVGGQMAASVLLDRLDRQGGKMLELAQAARFILEFVMNVGDEPKWLATQHTVSSLDSLCKLMNMNVFVTFSDFLDEAFRAEQVAGFVAGHVSKGVPTLGALRRLAGLFNVGMNQLVSMISRQWSALGRSDLIQELPAMDAEAVKRIAVDLGGFLFAHPHLITDTNPTFAQIPRVVGNLLSDAMTTASRFDLHSLLSLYRTSELTRFTLMNLLLAASTTAPVTPYYRDAMLVFDSSVLSLLYHFFHSNEDEALVRMFRQHLSFEGIVLISGFGSEEALIEALDELVCHVLQSEVLDMGLAVGILTMLPKERGLAILEAWPRSELLQIMGAKWNESLAPPPVVVDDIEEKKASARDFAHSDWLDSLNALAVLDQAELVPFLMELLSETVDPFQQKTILQKASESTMYVITDNHNPPSPEDLLPSQGLKLLEVYGSLPSLHSLLFNPWPTLSSMLTLSNADHYLPLAHILALDSDQYISTLITATLPSMPSFHLYQTHITHIHDPHTALQLLAELRQHYKGPEQVQVQQLAVQLSQKWFRRKLIAKSVVVEQSNLLSRIKCAMELQTHGFDEQFDDPVQLIQHLYRTKYSEKSIHAVTDRISSIFHLNISQIRMDLLLSALAEGGDMKRILVFVEPFDRDVALDLLLSYAKDNFSARALAVSFQLSTLAHLESKWDAPDDIETFQRTLALQSKMKSVGVQMDYESIKSTTVRTLAKTLWSRHRGSVQAVELFCEFAFESALFDTSLWESALSVLQQHHSTQLEFILIQVASTELNTSANIQEIALKTGCASMNLHLISRWIDYMNVSALQSALLASDHVDFFIQTILMMNSSDAINALDLILSNDAHVLRLLEELRRSRNVPIVVLDAVFEHLIKHLIQMPSLLIQCLSTSTIAPMLAIHAIKSNQLGGLLACGLIHGSFEWGDIEKVCKMAMKDGEEDVVAFVKGLIGEDEDALIGLNKVL